MGSDLTGRAALRVVQNPPNRWHATAIEWLDGPPEHTLELFEDHSRSILSGNDSPDIPFRWSVNPYRGCYHGCAYCYARPTHPYLDFGAGTDFERKLTFKPDAPRLLAEAFAAPRWRGELVVFSGVTDCYQPLEVDHQLTRRCLEVCLAHRNPVGIITKSTVIERDVELLAALARETHLTVTISIPFFDAEIARAMEPYVPKPERRLRTIERLAAAGVPVGVNVAPLIPGLGDVDAPRILAAAAAAGARFYGMTMLRLPGPVAEVFESRLRALLPLRADRVLAQIADCRDGAKNDPRFGHRMRGVGPRWDAIARLVEQAAARHGLGRLPPPPEPSPFRRPTAQLALW
jgi:DNA repair photolyase